MADQAAKTGGFPIHRDEVGSDWQNEVIIPHGETLNVALAVNTKLRFETDADKHSELEAGQGAHSISVDVGSGVTVYDVRGNQAKILFGAPPTDKNAALISDAVQEAVFRTLEADQRCAKRDKEGGCTLDHLSEAQAIQLETLREMVVKAALAHHLSDVDEASSIITYANGIAPERKGPAK